MASVRELKERLAAENAATIEASHTAIAAIDTLLNFSMWVLGILAIIIAIVAIFGYAAIKRYAARVAEGIANEKANRYIGSDEFLGVVEQTIAKEVQEHWRSTVVVNLDSRPASPSSVSAFDRLERSSDDDSRRTPRTT